MHAVYHQKSSFLVFCLRFRCCCFCIGRGSIAVRSARSSRLIELPADLGHVDVDAVEGFEHDDSISADNDHANAHLLTAGLLF